MRHAVSLVIENGEGEVLFALRSPTKKLYASTWSLPSYYVGEGETFEETVNRIGKNKLGVPTEAVKLINEGRSDRGDFLLFMHVYSARIIEGEPHMVSDDYTEFAWSEPMSRLMAIKIMGDCCRLYKEYLERSNPAVTPISSK